MRKAAMCLLALLIPFTIFAQTANGIIKGKLIDSKSKEALEFVTVALIPKGSSTPTNGCSTDESGSFTITQIKAGEYTIRISFVGYLDDTRTVQIAKGASIDLGTIRLKADNKLLKEVVITEQRSQMKFDIDKRVFTIDQNIAATGGSATDVLEDIPSVEEKVSGLLRSGLEFDSIVASEDTLAYRERSMVSTIGLLPFSPVGRVCRLNDL